MGTPERKSLVDILLHSEREKLERDWAQTMPADDLKPIPNGVYRCQVVGGELNRSRKDTLGYKLTLRLLEGEYAGRRLWHDAWLTKCAMPLAKRDLAKLGVTDLEQLDLPLPERIIVDVRVARRMDEDGMERSRVTLLDVVGSEPSEPEPCAPCREPDAGSTPATDKTAEPGHGDSGGFNWETGEHQDPPAPRRGR
jgi:hypothetical protein